MTAQRLGKYLLGDRIAVGGMAEVFRGKSLGAGGFEKEVALKRILPAFSEDPEFVRMFRAEATLAAKLQHANVVQIFDFDIAAGTYYIAMELVDGEDLRQVLREGERRQRPLPLPLAAYVVAEALRGLHYAHTRVEDRLRLRVIHRDISPHNLLLSYAGEVKLTDFGIARAAARSQAATGRGLVKGKLPYMAPEQLAGEDADERSDLYSMGVVLYEACTGARPFEGDSDGELVARVQRGLAVSPRARQPEVPADLEAIIQRMMARDAGDRYPTAEEALDAITRLSCFGYHALELSRYVCQLFPAQAPYDGHEITRTAVGPASAAGDVAPDERASSQERRASERASQPASSQAVTRTRAADVAPGAIDAGEPAARRPATVGAMARRDAVRLPSTGRRVGPRLARAAGWVAIIVAALAAWVVWRTRGTEVHSPPGQKPRAAQEQGGLTARVGAHAPTEVQPSPTPPPRADAEKPAVRGDDRRHPLTTEVERAASPASGPAASGARRHEKPPSAGRQGPAKLHPGTTRFGYLTVIVVPWARVEVDGMLVAPQTPIRLYRLPAGRHLLRLYNDDLGQDLRFPVQIQSSQELVVRRSFR